MHGCAALPRGDVVVGECERQRDLLSGTLLTERCDGRLAHCFEVSLIPSRTTLVRRLRSKSKGGRWRVQAAATMPHRCDVATEGASGAHAPHKGIQPGCDKAILV